MEAHVFAKHLYQIMKWPSSDYCLDLFRGERTCYVAANYAAYGKITSVVIEFEGSPPWCPVFVGNMYFGKDNWTITALGKKIPVGSALHRKVGRLLSEFLATHPEVRFDA